MRNEKRPGAALISAAIEQAIDRGRREQEDAIVYSVGEVVYVRLFSDPAPAGCIVEHVYRHPGAPHGAAEVQV